MAKTTAPGAARPIYLDHNATTPLDPDVYGKMTPFFLEKFGNPSSVEHAHGNEAHAAVEVAREQVAQTIGARASEIIFTGSCTEASNIAIFGVARAQPDKRHIVTSQVEHLAVLESVKALEREGYQVTYVRVDENGRVDPDDVSQALTTKTALVTIMAGNNEVGTLQPIREIGARCTERGVPFHSDLAQTVAYVPVDVEADNIHLASLSAHKAYGPKGIGALYVRSRNPRVRLTQVIFGGGQERGFRPGTMNTPLIVGMGEAFQRARNLRRRSSEQVRLMCKKLHQQLTEGIDGLVLNGHPVERLANNLSYSIANIEPLALIRLLRSSVSFSSSSACSSHEVKTSHVLLAMFGDGWRARHAFRLAPGRFTTEDNITTAAHAIVAGAQQLQKAAA